MESPWGPIRWTLFLCVVGGRGIIHVWGRRLREEVPLTGFMAVHSFPVFTIPVLIKGREVATLSGKPQQPVAACKMESAVQESSRSPRQHFLCFSLPPHQRNLQLIIMHRYEEIWDRKDTTSMRDGTLCLLVFIEMWASEDFFPIVAS